MLRALIIAEVIVIFELLMMMMSIRINVSMRQIRSFEQITTVGYARVRGTAVAEMKN